VIDQYPTHLVACAVWLDDLVDVLLDRATPARNEAFARHCVACLDCAIEYRACGCAVGELRGAALRGD
jgi:hypothetical protein